MEKLLTRLVKVARKAYKTDLALQQLGYDETPYFDIYGEILDGIYELLGEKTDTLEESYTYQFVIFNDYLPPEQAAKELMKEYRIKQNRPAQS